MTLDEYQQAAKRTMNPALSFEETSRHALHGMCAELGEVHGEYQKFYQGHDICTVNGWRLDAVARMNIDKLRARYPGGFAAVRSQHRAEGDV